jgi:hypothetical protein
LARAVKLATNGARTLVAGEDLVAAGRYTLTVKVGETTRVVRLRVRAVAR